MIAAGSARGGPLPAYDAGGRRESFLHPGEWMVSTTPAAIKTILGSCVAICLWDERLGIGGINHFLLPHGRGGGRDDLRYGNVALARLVAALEAAGARPGRLRAKVFGGACAVGPREKHAPTLGETNVLAAERLLAAEEIPIVSRDVGGERGRRVVFHTDSADAWVWLL